MGQKREKKKKNNEFVSISVFGKAYSIQTLGIYAYLFYKRSYYEVRFDLASKISIFDFRIQRCYRAQALFLLKE